MNESLKILHLMASHRWTGAAEPAARVAAGQTEQGHEVLFSLTTGSSFDKRAQELGVKTTDAVPFERTYWPHKKLRDLRCLKALIRDFQPQIVHTHLTHDHTLAAAALGPKGSKRPKLVRTFHREEKLRASLFTRRFVMARTDGVVVISEAMRRNSCQAYGLGEDRVALIGGGIDSERFRPTDRGGALRKKWGIPSDAVLIGLVSRLRVERGVEWLLDAAEEALPACPNARLVICGRGNYQDAMVERLKTHPAREQIHYAGYIEGTDLEDSYNAFDISLMLKPGNDGACRAALEAMACGKPIVGGDMGAIRDLVAGDSCGWLVPVGDRKALANAMKSAVDDPESRLHRGQTARQRILDTYSEEAMTLRTLAFYHQILKAIS